MAKTICLTCLWEQETGNLVDRSQLSKEWAEEVGVSGAAIRRHWKHQEEEDAQSHRSAKAVTNLTKKLSSREAAPKWQIVQPARRVVVEVPSYGPQPPRNKSLALKGGDTQIGYRRFSDGRTEAFHDVKAMDLFVQIAAIYQPDDIDLLGDLLDLPSQGKYVKEAAFSNTTQLAINYLHEWLAKLRMVCPSARITIIEGNHDKRMQNFVEMNAVEAFGLKRANLPEELPVMSIPYLLRLEELDIEYVDAYPTATKWDNANTRNIHGTRASSTGSTTSQYIRELPHINTWAGHTHRVEITYKNVLGPWGEAIESYSANPGMLARGDGAVPSVKGAIHSDGSSARTVEDWQQGFGFNYYDDEESWPFVYRIRDGRTIIDGVEIAV